MFYCLLSRSVYWWHCKCKWFPWCSK